MSTSDDQFGSLPPGVVAKLLTGYRKPRFTGSFTMIRLDEPRRASRAEQVLAQVSEGMAEGTYDFIGMVASDIARVSHYLGVRPATMTVNYLPVVNLRDPEYDRRFQRGERPLVILAELP